MQAIVTKYLPATNLKPARLKAFCNRGSITISVSELDGAWNEDERHGHCAMKLCEKLAASDLKEYGSPVATNPWMKQFATGGHPDGSRVH
jgi:hypothetical protein